MTDELSMGLERLLRKAEIEKDVDFLRQGVQLLPQAFDGARVRVAPRGRPS